MSTITLSEARENLTAWTDASKAVAKNQGYSINGRSLTRANAAEVRSMIDYWSRIVSSLERQAKGGARVGHSLARFSR